MINYILGGLILILIILASYKLYKNNKKGICSGCPNAHKCSKLK